MDGDYAELEFVDNHDLGAINGEEEEFYQQQQQQQQQQQRGIKSFDYLDSAGNDETRVSENQLRDSSAGKLFVGGISWETSEETFTNYFSKYGKVTDSVIMMDRQTGRPRGFGFVTFADLAVADRVLEEDHVIDARAVEVKRTVPREDMQVKGISSTKKIFVGGIPPLITEEDLMGYFSSYGNIVEHQIMLDHKTGRSRGFGFVTFDSEDAVEMIFSEGRTHELGGKQVEIKKAEPKRSWADYSGSAANSHGRNRGGAANYGGGYSSGGGYGGKRGRGYSGYDGGYGGYSSYGGGYDGASASFYGGYGGFGYGFGFGGPMYGNVGYAGSGYGIPGGYGDLSNYGAAAGYGGGKGYGSARGGYGNVKSYGGRGSSGGAASGSGSSGSGGGVAGRYHPYQR